MIRVVHVITGLGGGGAETTLSRLLGVLAPPEFDNHVIALTGDDELAPVIRRLGVPVHLLGMGKGPSALHGVWKLRRLLRRIAPDVVQTWLCHADLLGGIVAWHTLRCPVVWGVHQAEAPAATPWITRLVLALCARLAGRLPARVVSCSEAGRRARVAAGFPPDCFEVIPNGVDVTVFRPDPAARAAVRTALGVATGAPLLAWPARWHPDKDPQTFLACAARLHAARPEVRFLLFGLGLAADNAALVAAIDAAGLRDCMLLLGFRTDVPALFAACDFAVLSSATEALPNVVLEAMACGLPVAATDVGDVAEVVAACGEVVPPRDPVALAGAVERLLERDEPARRALAAAARERIERHYSLAATAARYAATYRTLAPHPGVAEA